MRTPPPTLAGRPPTPAPAAGAQPPWRSVAPVGAAALVLGVVMLALQFARLGPDVTAPFFVGSAWRLDDDLVAAGVRVTVVEGTGYDGQWFLGLAHDPLLTEGLASGFDMPRYRAGRPLYAMVGWALAGGAAGLLPHALLAAGPLALALGAAAGGRLLAAYGRSRWWGLGFAAIPGVIVGVTHATAEPLALALAALGLSLAAGSRTAAAGMAFAAAAMAKETYLVFALVAAAALTLGRRRDGRLGGIVRRAAWRAAVLVLPAVALLAGWSAYVSLMVPSGEGDAKALDAVGLPGLGWVEVARGIAAGTWVADAPVGPFGQVLLLGSLAAALAGIALGLRRPGLVGWAGVALGGYALCLSGYLLDHFLSSMRALAPCVFAAMLCLATARRPAAAPLNGPRLDPPPTPPRTTTTVPDRAGS